MTEEGNGAAAAASGKKKEKPAKSIAIPPKKPKLSKAERRALQESQRAAKSGGGGPSKPGQGGQGDQQQQQQHPSATTTKSDTNNSHSGQEEFSSCAKTTTDFDSIFSHLPRPRDITNFPNGFTGASLGKHTIATDVTATSSSTTSHNTGTTTATTTATATATATGTPDYTNLHPAVLRLGLLYASGKVRGGNARCRAMLHCFDKVLQDYHPPSHVKDIRTHLDHFVLKPSFNYWAHECRPHSVSMGNAFTLLKSALASLDRESNRDIICSLMRDTLQAYIQERIDFADQAIADFGRTKIVDGDVILTYAHSSVVELLLIQAAATKHFRVIVVDARPLLEGKQLLQHLTEANIDCTYVLMNALSYMMMEDVTKVFLGASALMSDGSVLGRVGTACVALLAQSCGKPTLVCCETYKISNRVQLESITGNELGSPQLFLNHTSSSTDDHNATTPPTWSTKQTNPTTNQTNNNSNELEGFRDMPNLMLLNLLYDLTPSDMVSGIVTEMGILPPTSVAVLLRELNPEGRTH